MAKKLFQEMNVNYKAIELDRYENGSQFQDILHQMTGSRTVSTIFFNLSFIKHISESDYSISGYF